MPTTFVEVATYKVFAYAGPIGNAGVEASISLGIADGFAFLNFFPEGMPLPPNRKSLPGPFFYVSYRSAQLGPILDLLRNEKPVRFFFRDETLVAYLTTADEPVGEEET
jgi:hypothetical protein